MNGVGSINKILDSSVRICRHVRRDPEQVRLRRTAVKRRSAGGRMRASDDERPNRFPAARGMTGEIRTLYLLLPVVRSLLSLCSRLETTKYDSKQPLLSREQTQDDASPLYDAATDAGSNTASIS